MPFVGTRFPLCPLPILSLCPVPILQTMGKTSEPAEKTFVGQELDFITETLRPDPTSVMALASMIRRGALKTAIAKYMGTDEPVAKKAKTQIRLADGTQTFRVLRHPILKDIASSFDDHMKKEVSILCEARPLAESETIVRDLVFFGLNKENKSKLPTDREGWQDVDKLCAMTAEHYKTSNAERLKEWRASDPYEDCFFYLY